MRWTRFLLVICTLGVASLYTLAQEKSEPAKGETKASQDLLYGAVDPIAIGAQRQAFLRIAGVDSELEEKEFAADTETGTGFARSFDTWETIARFDANRNGTIDWLEVADYRIRFRDQLLGRHDKDKNKRLTGEERAAALKELGGELGVQPPPPVQPGADTGAAEYERIIADRRKTNRKFTKEENQFMMEYEQRTQNNLARQLIRSEKEPWLSDDAETRNLAEAGLFLLYDQDGDGRVTDADGTLFEIRHRLLRKKNSEERMRKALAAFDANANGKLDPEETAALKAKQRAFLNPEWSDQIMKGSPEPLPVAMQAQLEFGRILAREKFANQDRFDEDSDGVLNVQEAAARYRHMGIDEYLDNHLEPKEREGCYGDYRSRHWRDFDADEDGKLNADEVVMLNAAFTKETEGRAPITAYPTQRWHDTSHIPNP